MKNEITNQLTSSKIAEALGVSDGKVKKAIKELGIKPVAKKGVCSYYSRNELGKIKQVLKNAG
jgi:Mn-dependent DtxR family transcriptional regulator